MNTYRDLLTRTLDRDIIVRGDDWLAESGIRHQLEHEGFQLRWVTTSKLDANLADGWNYVTVSHYLWWRRQGPRNQYLLKRQRSFRSRDSGCWRRARQERNYGSRFPERQDRRQQAPYGDESSAGRKRV